MAYVAPDYSPLNAIWVRATPSRHCRWYSSTAPGFVREPDGREPQPILLFGIEAERVVEAQASLVRLLAATVGSD